MQRLAEVTLLLNQVLEEAALVIDNDPDEKLSTIEVFLAALSNMAPNDTIKNISYSSPVGVVDVNSVEFVIDEDMTQPLYPLRIVEEDDE